VLPHSHNGWKTALEPGTLAIFNSLSFDFAFMS
jgi:hypothetical protein